MDPDPSEDQSPQPMEVDTETSRPPPQIQPTIQSDDPQNASAAAGSHLITNLSGQLGNDSQQLHGHNSNMATAFGANGSLPSTSAQPLGMLFAASGTPSNLVSKTQSANEKSTSGQQVATSSSTKKKSQLPDKSVKKQSWQPFVLSCTRVEIIKESLNPKTETTVMPHMYACAINPYVPQDNDQVGVSVGLRTVFLYQLPVKTRKLKLWTHATVDVPEEEGFYTVTWCLDHQDTAKKHKIVCGGEAGVLYVINGSSLEVERSLIGHNKAIMDVRTNPVNPSLVVTASKDKSVRIYHIRQEYALLILGFRGGHTDTVVSADWSPNATSIISGGFSHKIIIWDLELPEVANHLKECLTKIDAGQELQSLVRDVDAADRLCSGVTPFDLDGYTLIASLPSDVIRDVHLDCVDCIRTLELDGREYIISKATGAEKGLTLWRTGLLDPNGEQQQEGGINRTFVQFWFKEIDHWQSYFSKFAIDPLREWVAATTSEGTVNFYKLFENHETTASLSVQVCEDQAHEVSFSTNGQILLAVGANGVVARFDRNLEPNQPESTSSQQGTSAARAS